MNKCPIVNFFTKYILYRPLISFELNGNYEMRVASTMLYPRTVKLIVRSTVALCLIPIAAAMAETRLPPNKALNPAAQLQADRKFKALYQQEAAFRAREFPGRIRSDEEDPGLSGDNSDAAEQRRLPMWQKFAADAEKIPSNLLSNESRINLRIFSNQLRNQINATSLHAYLLTFNSDSQFWASTATMGDSARCTNMKSCTHQLQLLKNIERSFDEKIELMRLGIERGMTVPQIVLNGRDVSIARHVVAQPELSVFYKAFAELPAAMPASQRQSLQNDAKAVITDSVIPAYRKLLQFVRDEYMPKARTTIAAYDLPNGKAYYRAQVLEYTTLDTSPEDIHSIGLTEVARIRSDMAKIMGDLQFQGDFPAFLKFLRTDPQFYAKTPHELLAEAAYWAKKADGLLPKYFGKLPRKPYGVAPVPADIAPTYTAGRYAGSNEPTRASNYWVNTSLLDQRPLWALPALTLHEAVPGHHLQISLAGEQGEQPEFRRNSYISAYGEGWALYAEHLGVEMGFYETPYQNFGRLVYEMWRAARLVVDTGMHAKGWSRDQALAFMRDNTALSEHEITTEIDRYISWPGQALAYKLGEIKIREIRKKSEQTLAEGFDLRAFHDKLLALGSVPLSILESEMALWTETMNKVTNKGAKK